MKMVKRTSVAGAWARKEPYDYDGKHYDADITNGDVVKFLNAGSVVMGEHGEQQVFSIETRNGSKNVALNQSSINALIEVYGEDSDGWVNREARVLTKKDVVAGKKVIIAYIVPKDYVLNEYGELERRASDSEKSVDPDAEELSPEDIPF